MPDREKVIKGLEHCTRPSEVGKGGNFCMDCPYTEAIGFNQFKCNGQQMKRDALALLKEQEAVIHCIDCCYYHKPEYGFTFGDCTRRSAWYSVAENEFCSLAKRKEGR